MSSSRRSRILAVTLVILVVLSPVLAVAASGDLEETPEKSIKPDAVNPNLQTVLQEIANEAQQNLAVAEELAGRKGIAVDRNAIEVIIEPVGGRSSNVDLNELRALGAEVETTSKSLVRASIPMDKFTAVTSKVRGVDFIRLPRRPQALKVDTSEGVEETGAADYHEAGFSGEGTKVAIIDLGFQHLSDAKSSGDVPPDAVAFEKDYTGSGGIETTTHHGTDVAEIVHDMAPDAELYLMKIGGGAGFEEAKDDAISEGVDVINHSVGWFNSSFYDGTGFISSVAADARDNGILWINAAGNSANNHWQGSFVDDGNGRHDFGGGDTCHGLGGIGSGSVIKINMTWDAWPNDAEDYDLYLWNSEGKVVASSDDRQSGSQPPTESIRYSVDSSDEYCFSVENYDAPSTPDLEVFVRVQYDTPTMEYPVEESSIVDPANDQKVITTGAIDWSEWTSGSQEDFSSQGPTNDSQHASSRTKPDLMGPDRVSTSISGSFAGTSASAPHLAGAVALLLSEDSSRSPSEVRDKLESDAADMGVDGKDNIYGYGRLVLEDVSSSEDTTAPTPDPMTWDNEPSAASSDSIEMEATSASDPEGNGVEYYFEETSGNAGGGDRDWGESRSYTDTGLELNTEYCYRVKARDKSDNQNETQYSTEKCTSPTNQAPEASFDYTPSNPTTDETVTFDASGSSDPDGSIETYGWDWQNDGSYDVTTSSAIVEHSFSGDGTHTVELKVEDEHSATDTTTRDIEVSSGNTGPRAEDDSLVADAGPDRKIKLTETTTLDATGSSDPEGDSLSYSWSLLTEPVPGGPGSISLEDVLSDPSSAQPVFFPTDTGPSNSGAYRFELEVSDGQGNSDTDRVKVIATPAPSEVRGDSVDSKGVRGSNPPAVDMSEKAGLEVDLKKMDPSTRGIIGGFKYAKENFPEDKEFPGRALKYADVKAVDMSSGEARISLRYTDGEASEFAEEKLQLHVYYNGNWEKAENTTVDPANNVVAGDVPVSKLYGSPITASENQDLAADFSYSPSNPTTDETVTFDASGSSDPDGTIETYGWDWDDDGDYEESSSSETAEHSFSNSGDHPVTLEVVSSTETTDSLTRTVTVEDSTPPALITDFSASDDEDSRSSLTWTNPPDSDLGAVAVRRKTGGYPTDHSDGSLVYENQSPEPGTSDSYTDEDLENGTTYYYAVFGEDDSDNWNDTVEEGSNADTGEPFYGATVDVDNPGWNMVSLPVTPGNGDPKAVFGELNRPNMVYRWEPGLNDGEGGFLSPGDGLNELEALEALEGLWVFLEENEAPKSFSVKGTHESSREVILAEAGWHQVGSQVSYNWSDIGVKQGPDGETMSVPDQADGADAPRWISKLLFEWDSSGEEYVVYDADSDSKALTPGEGYWVRSYVDDVRLVIPFQASSSSTEKDISDGIPVSELREEDVNAPPVPPFAPDGTDLADLEVRASPNPAAEGRVEFSVQGTGIDAVKVRIYDPSGKKVYSSPFRSGNEVTWSLTDNREARVSNGIYIYQLEARDSGGKTRVSQVRRLVVLK